MRKFQQKRINNSDNVDLNAKIENEDQRVRLKMNCSNNKNRIVMRMYSMCFERVEIVLKTWKMSAEPIDFYAICPCTHTHTRAEDL